MPIRVSHLDASNDVLMKLGARGISLAEARQLLFNGYETRPDPRDRGRTGKRHLLLGRTNGGRTLMLVIEPTFDSTDWLIVTAWET
jgi:uncharacterized DUF497 family protein